MADIALHDALEPLGFLLGTWKGKGHGDYPSIDAFDYLEVATFTHVGKPFLAYAQRTQHATTGLPLHAETGYLRPTGPTSVELVLAQPTGIIEIHEGEIDGTRLAFASVAVHTTASAMEVTQVGRSIDVDGDVMRYAIDMAATGHAFQRHLTAELGRDL